MNDAPNSRNEISDLLADFEPTSAAESEPFVMGCLVAGDRIHFLSTATVSIREGSYGGQMVERGQTITITDEILRLNVDRTGWSWLTLVDDRRAQTEKWGKPRFGRGPFPESEPLHLPGSAEAEWAAREAYEAAKRLPELEARAERARTRAEFGTPTTQRTLGNF
jgi:hypothetical protein